MFGFHLTLHVVWILLMLGYFFFWSHNPFVIKFKNYLILVEIESKIWLQYNKEPWEEVMKHWKLTFEVRRDFICRTVSDYIREWPLVEDPRAECLVCLIWTHLHDIFHNRLH